MTRWFPRAIGLLTILLSAMTHSAAAGDNLATRSGGLEIVFDQATGRLVALQTAAHSVLAPSGVAGSGFALRDHAIDKAPLPLTCTVRRQADALEFSAARDGLRLSATCTAIADGWEFRATVARTDDRERFLSLRFGLPVDVGGWRQHVDLLRERPMAPERDATNANPIPHGSRLLDYLPMSAISSELLSLGYAVRMDQQWFRHVRYEGRDRVFGHTLDFALINGSGHFERSATFHFFLFAPAGRDGLRAVVRDYFMLFPQWGASPQCAPGGWSGSSRQTAQKPPISDFGLIYHEIADGGACIPDHKTLGTKSLWYIEPTMYQQHRGDLPREPTKEEVYSRLRTDAEAAAAGARPRGPHQQWIHDISAAILRSPVQEAGGEPVTPHGGNWGWIGGTHYGAQLPLNLDPAIPGGVGQERLDECRKMLTTRVKGATCDGIYLDSYNAWMMVDDFNRRNIICSDVPPSFNAELKPCVAVWCGMQAWTRALRKLLGPDQQYVMPNMGLSGPFAFDALDVIGREWAPDALDSTTARFRQVAYHKILTDLPYAKKDYRALKSSLLFNLIPGGQGTAESPQEMMRDSYRKLLPLLRIEYRLGWEPITHAATDDPTVLVERYGRPGGPILLAVSNSRYPGRRRILVDAKALEIPKTAWCVDALGEAALSWRRDEGRLAITAALDGGDTALLVLGDAKAQQEYLKMLAADRLGDARFCFREYEAREKKIHPIEAEVKGLAASLDRNCAEAIDAVAARIEPHGLVLTRAVELLHGAAATLRAAAGLTPAVPLSDAQLAQVKLAPLPSLSLPWKADFDAAVKTPPPYTHLWADGLKRGGWAWNVNRNRGRIDCQQGRLIMELKESGSIGLRFNEVLDFGIRPVEIQWQFEHQRATSRLYGGTFLGLQPADGGAEEEYLHVRIGNGSRIRMENQETRLSHYVKGLFDYQAIEPNRPHVARLRLDRKAYALEIDGHLMAQGTHGVSFSRGFLNLSMSGNPGVPEVWCVGSLTVRPIDKVLTSAP